MTTRVYGSWSGREHGTKKDPKRCIEAVYPRTGFPISNQCTRPRGHGPDKLYCKQHGRRAQEIADRVAALDRKEQQ